jgi:hypothetical protein
LRKRPAFSALLSAAIVLPLCLFGASWIVAQQANPTHTPKDFMDAQDAAQKALDAVQQVLRRHGALRATAEDAAARIKQLSKSRATDASVLKTLTDEDQILKDLSDAKVLDGLAPTNDLSKDDLAGPKDTLDKVKAKLESLKGDNNGADFAQVLTADQQTLVTQTLADCRTALDQANKDGGLNQDSYKKLTDALPTIVTQVAEAAAALTKTLQPLSDLPGNSSETDDVLKKTSKYLPQFVSVVDLRDDFKKDKNLLATDLEALVATIDLNNNSSVSQNLTSLDTAVTNIAGKLSGWLDTVKQAPASKLETLEKDIVAVDKDATANTAAAQADLKAAIPVRDSAQSVVDTWTKLKTIRDKLGRDGDFLDSTGANSADAKLDEFTQNTHALAGATSRLQEAIAGDFSNFEADQQQLYYFTDVPRLIKMLNPGAYEIGGISGVQEQAAAQRQKLAQAELDLAAAQADVNTYQTQLMQLPEQLRQARAEARRQDQAYGRTSNRLANLNDRLSSVTDQINPLKNSGTGASAAQKQNDQNAVAKAQKDKDRLTAQTADAQRDNTNALHDKDVADQNLKALEDSQTGIPAQIEKAKQALQAAQNNVSQRRQASLLAAQAESDAFALARDNRPYWFAPASAVSKDVARRVEMYGTNESKIIYMRGKRADLEAVKDIIAGIDKPAPQARVTLWSVQLNYTSDTKGKAAKQMNDALFSTEDRLSEIRSRMAISISFLRDAVNSVVNAQAANACKDVGVDECRLARIRKFYGHQVLLELGDANPQTPSAPPPTSASTPPVPNPFAEISRFTVPDPSATTTLGEALLILSLASPAMRAAIMWEFQTRVNNEHLNSGTWHSSEAFGKTDMRYLVEPKFTRLVRALNAEDGHPTQSAEELTAAQLEIVRALKSASASRMSARVASLMTQLAVERKNSYEICKQIEGIDKALNPRPPRPHYCEGMVFAGAVPAASGTPDDLLAGRENLRAAVYNSEASLQSLASAVTPLLLFFRDNLGIPPASFRNLDGERLEEAVQRVNVNPQADAEFYSSMQRFASQSRRATPRQAAADEMLKELMTAMEEDLERIFVRPGLADLREDLARQSKLQVGVLQRTSTLATNRLQARVDPRSSAQLAIGEQQDILDSVMQLGQIYMAAQTGGALGTLNALNNLKQNTKEPPQEIYGITTGSTFKITPIFDPSGQALRFQFDYVAANNVTEPSGTTNPQLPRIERHTINTEVQISNLEVREISRYEANSRLGIPTKYWGGIPLVKDVLEQFPTVRPYFPLFGWFVRKAGSGAVSQESVLFGQTAIYPTIGDLVELLTGGEDTPRVQ